MSQEYDKYPAVNIPGNWNLPQGWDAIKQAFFASIAPLENVKKMIVVETYQGAPIIELAKHFQEIFKADNVVLTTDLFLDTKEIIDLTFPDVTDDRIFGKMTHLDILDFFDKSKIDQFEKAIENENAGVYLLIGPGASKLYANPYLFIYYDLCRWELQLRMRRHLVGNLGLSNLEDSFSVKYKRGYFVDWRVCDDVKRETYDKWDFYIDGNELGNPKMLKANDYKNALAITVSQPFRVVPFFDPGPWGGQWIMEKFNMDRKAPNYAWGFDCVPEENSLFLQFGKVSIETPAINLVFFETISLLGENVVDQFGAEFPIRFDLLDTVKGGNLSLQVHPLKSYIKEKFGMAYTQDESYYILHAEPDAKVYLGFKENIEPEKFVEELNLVQTTNGSSFPAEEYVATFPAKKHDHFLIPAGTIHCSGTGNLVLEISATPYIFTFKLWDWARLGLDGMPRPINIKHGIPNLIWDRKENWVANNLVNQFEPVEEGDGWREEKTGLHESQFIETRRHWFQKTVHHHTNGTVQVLNLVEGDEVVVESPTQAFEPINIHFAETFIVPAKIGAFTVRPLNENKSHGTIKAYVRS